MEFEQTSSIFLNWFKSQPGTSFHDSLQIVDLRSRHAGRGIIATSDIPADTVLFIIPRSIVLDVQTSELARRLPQLFVPEEDHQLDDPIGEQSQDLPRHWLNLILVLLYESFRPETTPWQPYFATLPLEHQSFDSLMFWTEQELGELQASSIREKIGKESANRMFRQRIIPIVNARTDIFYPDSHARLADDELLERCHVLGSLIMSYAFDLQSDEEDDDEGDSGEDGWIEDRSADPMLGMVPMADLLNADAEFNAHLSHGDHVLTMTALREIKAGEEVLNYYGALPNAELLRRYGYTSPKHSRYDVVELGWSFVSTQIASRVNNDSKQLQEALQAWADAEDIRDDDGFVLERDPGDPNEQGQLSPYTPFSRFPEDLIDLLETVAPKLIREGDKKRKAGGNVADASPAGLAYDMLRQILAQRAAQYPTTIDEDAAILSNLAPLSRQAMAVEVRLGEKCLLKEALDCVETRQQRLKEKEAARHKDGKVSHDTNKKQKR